MSNYIPQHIVATAVAAINAAGFPANFEPSDYPGEEDDEIQIANPGKGWTLGLQIGSGYVCVNRYTDETSSEGWTMQQLSEHANLITAVDEAITRLKNGDDKP